jgi:hypothetical protein
VILTKTFAGAGLASKMKLVMTPSDATILYTQSAGSAADGVVMAAALGVIAPELPVSPIKTEIDKLATPFAARYGGQSSEFAADAYSGAELLFAALKQVGPGFSRTAIQAALNHLSLLTPDGKYIYTSPRSQRPEPGRRRHRGRAERRLPCHALGEDAVQHAAPLAQPPPPRQAARRGGDLSVRIWARYPSGIGWFDYWLPGGPMPQHPNAIWDSRHPTPDRECHYRGPANFPFVFGLTALLSAASILHVLFTDRHGRHGSPGSLPAGLPAGGPAAQAQSWATGLPAGSSVR